MQQEGISSQLFASWGLGTGQTLFWTKDGSLRVNNFTSSSAPQTYSNREISEIISARPVAVDEISDILVDIPSSIVEKHLPLVLDGYERVPDEPLPFWMMFDGAIWTNPGISHEDI